jgi:release factor glutamine methyltransferase
MTLAEWRQLGEDKLVKAGFENASQEAKWLLVSALGRENAFIILNPTYLLSKEEEDILQIWLERRLQGEPLSRIKGVREFWSLPFHLNEHTLDPRPDTEVIVEGVLKWIGDQKDFPWRILDLGTGTGCILIALLSELRRATGVGVDLSEGALDMAKSNAALNGVDERATFQQGSWGTGLEGFFDIIVSNPPYIPLKDKNILEKGVLHFDPSPALFGGEDGLDCYPILIGDFKRLLAPNGMAVLEIGYGQRKAVEALLHSAGFKTLSILKDLAGIERGIVSSPTHTRLEV